MDYQVLISQTELAELKKQVEYFNKTLETRSTKNELDKNDFLRLLITQLTHQDPTQPLEDREFISQMAQFSTLEQMTNINSEIAKVFQVVMQSQALSLLGKTVEIFDNENFIQGMVKEVTGGDVPQVLVNDTYYDILNIERVMR